MKINLEKIYSVPKRKDENDSSVWYRTLNNATFAFPEMGWVVGSAQVIKILTQEQSCRNYYKRESEIPFCNSEYIFAIDDKICWQISGDTVTRGKVCVTFDGGVNWKSITFGSNFDLLTMYFLDSENGWIMAKNVDENSYVQFMTCNGGLEWSNCVLEIPCKPRKAIFQDLERGWMLGDRFTGKEYDFYSSIFYTINGGRNWQSSIDFCNQIYDFNVIDSDWIIAVGESGKIFITQNNLKTSKSVKSGVRINLNACEFLDREFGVIVGDSGTVIIFHKDEIKLFRTRKNENFIGVSINYETKKGFLISDKSVYNFGITLKS